MVYKIARTIFFCLITIFFFFASLSIVEVPTDTTESLTCLEQLKLTITEMNIKEDLLHISQETKDSFKSILAENNIKEK